MAKKRKAAGQPFGHSKARDAEDRPSKLGIGTYEDVADSEDEFHLGRDKILLDDGPEAKRRRKRQEQGVPASNCVWWTPANKGPVR